MTYLARIASLAGLAVLAAPAVARGCPPAGARIVLRSEAMDPDVLLWATRYALQRYVEQIGVDASRVDVRGARLVAAGTTARIVDCTPLAIRPRFTRALDAVGVRVLEGVDRGRYGWTSQNEIEAPTAANGPALFLPH